MRSRPRKSGGLIGEFGSGRDYEWDGVDKTMITFGVYPSQLALFGR